MAEPLMKNFDHFQDASDARQALVDAGWSADALELRVLQDEAGPVEGNFLVGNGRTGAGNPQSTSPGGGDAVPYDLNFERPVAHGVHLLLVQAHDDQQRQTADAILQRFGARSTPA